MGFFLYPMMYHENSDVHLARGNMGAGFIHARGLFEMMERLESIGVPVRFPHPPALYRILASKTWTHCISPAKDWGVPATVSLPRGLAERDQDVAAKKAILQLESVRHAHGKRGPVRRGVAKLGFSWEALDVTPWYGAHGLA